MICFKKDKATFDGCIAYSICKRIDEAEQTKEFIIQNPEAIESLEL